MMGGGGGGGGQCSRKDKEGEGLSTVGVSGQGGWWGVWRVSDGFMAHQSVEGMRGLSKMSSILS